nr:hypothetical protein [Candidatus Symbiopectobacterium sp. PLON1]
MLIRRSQQQKQDANKGAPQATPAATVTELKARPAADTRPPPARQRHLPRRRVKRTTAPASSA